MIPRKIYFENVRVCYKLYLLTNSFTFEYSRGAFRRLLWDISVSVQISFSSRQIKDGRQTARLASKLKPAREIGAKLLLVPVLLESTRTNGQKCFFARNKESLPLNGIFGGFFWTNGTAPFLTKKTERI